MLLRSERDCDQVSVGNCDAYFGIYLRGHVRRRCGGYAMNDPTRQQILDLRAKGLSYNAIARRVGLSKTTIVHACSTSCESTHFKRSRSDMPYDRFLSDLVKM